MTRDKFSVGAYGSWRSLLQQHAQPGESLSAAARRLILRGATAQPSAPRGFSWSQAIAEFELDNAAGELRLNCNGTEIAIPFLGDCS